MGNGATMMPAPASLFPGRIAVTRKIWYDSFHELVE
jgi:hypothetical protein